MKRVVKRINRGLEKIVQFYSYNVINGARKILQSGKDFNVKFYQSMEKLITDGIEDIDNRLNKKKIDDFMDDDALVEEDDSETNVLTDYCFGDIYGPNYGIRTFIEFEEECEEGSTCIADIEPESNNEIDTDKDEIEDRIPRNFDIHFGENGE